MTSMEITGDLLESDVREFVYLAGANSVFFTFFSFNRTNNFRAPDMVGRKSVRFLLQESTVFFYSYQFEKRTGLGPHPGRRKTEKVAVSEGSAKENSEHFSFRSRAIENPQLRTQKADRFRSAPHPGKTLILTAF
jgi:hypothetical protein